MQLSSLSTSATSIGGATLLAAALVLAGCSTDSSQAGSTGTPTPTSDAAGHDDTTSGDVMELDDPRRLLVVAAHDEAVVELIDIADGSSESLDLDAPASLASSMTETGRFLLAGHDAAVTVLDTGVWSDTHGTHAHHYSSTPAVLGQVEGPSPTHLISHGGLSSLWFDGTGAFSVIDEEKLGAGEVSVMADVETGQPHHGFAVPTSGAFFITVPTDDMDGLPNAVGIGDTDGTVQEQFDCPATHGEASLIDGAAAACSDGVVLVSEDGGEWSSTHLTYPAVEDEDPFGGEVARAWLLEASQDQGLLAAVHGSAHILVVDPENETIESFQFQGGTPTLLGLAFSDDGRLVVLTEDGVVHLVDPRDGSIDASLPAITEFADADSDQPRRQVAASGDHLYVPDAATDQVVELKVGTDSLSVERTIDLDFTPGFVAVANG